MPQLRFTSPVAGGEELIVDVGPDAITWSYGLNTANFPTYGGEVVQILSCYMDDISVQGTVSSYKKLEEIYAFFINYIQQATVGQKGQGSYDTRPVGMYYEERGWSFAIYPKEMPGFKYGRDVVAPEWHLTAAVEEQSADFSNLAIDKATKKFIESEGVELFGKITSVDFTDPFNDPFSGPTDDRTKYKKGTPRSAYGELSDAYNNILSSYYKSDFEDLTASYSKPTFLKGGQTDGKNTGTPGA